LDRVLDHADAVLIALMRCGEDRWRAHLLADNVAGTPGDGGAGRKRLDAAAPTTSAERTRPVDGHMAGMSGEAVAADLQLAIKYDAGADAGRHGDESETPDS